eukprot:g2775.t1
MHNGAYTDEGDDRCRYEDYTVKEYSTWHTPREVLRGVDAITQRSLGRVLLHPGGEIIGRNRTSTPPSPVQRAEEYAHDSHVWYKIGTPESWQSFREVICASGIPKWNASYLCRPDKDEVLQGCAERAVVVEFDSSAFSPQDYPDRSLVPARISTSAASSTATSADEIEKRDADDITQLPLYTIIPPTLLFTDKYEFLLQPWDPTLAEHFITKKNSGKFIGEEAYNWKIGLVEPDRDQKGLHWLTLGAVATVPFVFRFHECLAVIPGKYYGQEGHFPHEILVKALFMLEALEAWTRSKWIFPALHYDPDSLFFVSLMLDVFDRFEGKMREGVPTPEVFRENVYFENENGEIKFDAEKAARLIARNRAQEHEDASFTRTSAGSGVRRDSNSYEAVKVHQSLPQCKILLAASPYVNEYIEELPKRRRDRFILMQHEGDARFVYTARRMYTYAETPYCGKTADVEQRNRYVMQPNVVRLARKHFAMHYPGFARELPPIFVARRWTTRVHIEHDALLEQLRKTFENEVVDFVGTGLPLKEQWAAFSQAGVVIGACGAAFANLLHTRPDDPFFVQNNYRLGMVELVSHHREWHSMYFQLSVSLGLDYRAMQGEDFNKTHFHIPPERIVGLLLEAGKMWPLKRRDGMAMEL